jgi:uncharacterized membrane protein YobD (UPF0266 family)
MFRKVELYIISLSPLFFLLLLSKLFFNSGEGTHPLTWESLYKENVCVSIFSFFVILAYIFYQTFNYQISDGATNLVQVKSVSNNSFEALSFLATYIIPLICFDVGSSKNLFLLMGMLVIMGAIYIKTNQFYTNPALALFGFQIFKIETLNHKDIIIIMKGRLKKEQWLYLKEIDDNIYYAKLNLEK